MVELFRELTRRVDCEILEGHLLPTHAQMLISKPPKYSVSQLDEFIKGKGDINTAGSYAGRKEL